MAEYFAPNLSKVPLDANKQVSYGALKIITHDRQKYVIHFVADRAYNYLGKVVPDPNETNLKNGNGASQPHAENRFLNPKASGIDFVLINNSKVYFQPIPDSLGVFIKNSYNIEHNSEPTRYF